jgi:tol-pal system protein YbgF
MKRLLGSGCLLLLLVGCLPPAQSQLKLENDLEEMKRHLARLEQGSNAGGSKVRRQLEALGVQVAELQSGLNTLRVDFQSINGRLDDLGRSNEQATADMSLVRDDLSMQVSVLSERLMAIEGKSGKVVAAPTPATPIATKPAPAVVKTESKPTPEEAYRQALEKILNGSDFSTGRAELEAFIKQNPRHELAVNAHYWIGESLYGDKKYEDSILKFQEVIQTYSDHPKAAAALLKQGKAFTALGDAENAATTWKQLIKTFPLSPEAEKAKELLK